MGESSLLSVDYPFFPIYQTIIILIALNFICSIPTMIAYSASENYPIAESQTPPPPPHTPVQILEELRQFCSQGDFQKFKKTLDSSFIGLSPHHSTIFDLSVIMVQVIKTGRTCFVKELLRHGLPILPVYVYEATKAHAKGILGNFLENGWDINQPMGPMHPPILR